MDDNITPETATGEPRADKLGRLVREETAAIHNPRHTRRIRRLRLILPVVALGILAVVFVWGDIQRNNLIPIQAVKTAPAIGKNELLNPRFESSDSKGQPYTITANRAVQAQGNDNLVLLDDPKGDMKLEDGHTVTMDAQTGNFHQDTQLLELRRDVHLRRDGGYVLSTEELDLDLKQNTALSKVDVYAQGPEGNIEAKGLEGAGDQGLLVFNGPAKLILTNVSGGMGGLPQ